MKKIVLFTGIITIIICSLFGYFYFSHSFDDIGSLKKKIKKVEVDISRKEESIKQLEDEITKMKIDKSKEVERLEVWEKELKNLEESISS